MSKEGNSCRLALRTNQRTSFIGNRCCFRLQRLAKGFRRMKVNTGLLLITYYVYNVLKWPVPHGTL